MSRFIQITDLHIGNETEYPLGVNLRKNFMNCLAEALTHKPDYFLLTGDFCLKAPHRTIYEWIKPILDETAIPYYVIRGNHDSRTDFTQVFGVEHLLIDEKLYFREIISNIQFLFLDTANGEIDEQQLHWMKNLLQSYEGQSIIIMHHPPCLAGIPHMDHKHHLRNWEQFQTTINETGKFVNIFCGHYHTERSIQLNNSNIFITPSLYVQIDDRTDAFQPEHYNPAFRIIDTNPTQLMTRVIYLNPSRV